MRWAKMVYCFDSSRLAVSESPFISLAYGHWIQGRRGLWDSKPAWVMVTSEEDRGLDSLVTSLSHIRDHHSQTDQPWKKVMFGVLNLISLFILQSILSKVSPSELGSLPDAGMETLGFSPPPRTLFLVQRILLGIFFYTFFFLLYLSHST